MVENFRLEKGKSVDLEYRYYISSKELSAEQAAMAVREHWGIESMHWVLDVTMNEDACQIYKEPIMPTSYEFKHAPRRANQTKHSRETKAMYDEYVHARGGIKCRFQSSGEKLDTHAVALAKHRRQLTH
ncbi:hypothetical protein VIAG107301_14150 [Vibrio agarivorans]